MENIYAPSGQAKNLLSIAKSRPWYVVLFIWFLAGGLLAGYAHDYVYSKHFNPLWKEGFYDRVIIVSVIYILLFGLIFREITTIRKEKFANVQTEMHSIMHILRDLNSVADEAIHETSKVRPSKKEIERKMDIIRDGLSESLDCFSRAFSILTGNYCRATIKLIDISEDGILYVYTLCRDREGERANRKTDRDRYDQKLDLLKDNEDFALLFDQKERWFFDNNLKSRKNYSNTKDPKLNSHDRKISFLNSILPSLDWDLPYISTIVWPIRQGISPTINSNVVKIAGFLAIDSRHRRVFNEKYDSQFGAAVSDSLFHLLMKWILLQEGIPSIETAAIAHPKKRK